MMALIKTVCPGDRLADRTNLGIGPDERLLLFVGNLVPVKAIDVLLRACVEPAQGRAVPSGHCRAGPLRTALEGASRKLGLAARVQFVGGIPQTELPRWYRAADVFVLPSHSEGVPNVLLEAFACGTPWVASRIGGIPEIAHLGVSRMVAPSTPSELAVAIRETLDSPRGELRGGPKPREEAVDELVQFLTERLGHAHGRDEVAN